MAMEKEGFRAIRKTQRRARLSTTQIIALVFLGIILLGTLLLMLPVSSADGKSTSFMDALFTATSATCVTGLVVGDTGTIWSGFGQTVIILMIEIGGLGFMSAAAMMFFLLRKKVGLRQRMVIAQALSLDDMESVVRIQKLVIGGSLAIQGVAAILLALRFLIYVPFATAVKWGLFHSVSAFCNAGFDIFGYNDSVMHFASDPIVLSILMILVVVGGLGFFVWEELIRHKSIKKCSVYTKLVLITTAALLVLGTVMTLLLEWDNPKTLGSMSWGDKILNSIFQSVTLRTAGFAAIDQAFLTDGSKALSVVLMLIGGSSGSTAGGLKTVTFIVLILFLGARLRGRDSVNVFRRRIPEKKVLDAMTIVGLVVGLTMIGTIVITATSPIGFADSIYEAASALGTVGLTAGATGKLSLVGRILIVIFMYFGRVGVLTLSMGFLLGNQAKSRYEYAQTNLMIG